MGGWVSDHAVRDPGLGTLHVFTAVEIARIPPRKRACGCPVHQDMHAWFTGIVKARYAHEGAWGA